MRTTTISFTNYEKVLVFVTFKDASHFTHRDVDSLAFEPGSTVIKLFQDVPKADLELIGVPAVISGAIVASTKLITTMGLLILLLGFYLGLRDERVELD